MAIIPVPRFSIDWDDDGFFCKEAVPTDPLNLINEALSMRLVDITPDPGCLITRKNTQSLYGLSGWEFGANSSSVILLRNPYANRTSEWRVQGSSSSTTVVNVDTTGIVLVPVGHNVTAFQDVAQGWVYGATLFDEWQFDVYFDVNVGSPTHQVRWEVRDDAAGAPSEKVLGYGYFTPVPNSLNTILFKSSMITASSIFWLIFTATTEKYGHYYQIRYNAANPYASSRMYTRSARGTWGGTATDDLRCTITETRIRHDKSAQKIVLPQTTTIDKLSIWVRQVTTHAGDTFRVRIETDSGGNPSGTLAHANATQNVVGPAGTTGKIVPHSLLTFDFTNFNVAAGTYWIVLDTTTVAPTDKSGTYLVDDNQKFGQTFKYYDGTTWQTRATNLVFELYGIPTATVSGVFGKDSSGIVNDIAVTASNNYVATCWIKGISGYTGVGVDVTIKNQAGTSQGTNNITLSGNWQRVNLAFTASGGSTHIYWEIVANNSAAVFQVTGFMLVSGSTPAAGYNTGHSTNLYDNITLQVEKASWQMGRANPDELIFAEGIANLTLKNTDRRFSPEYSSSPIYGYIKPNLRMQIEIQRPSDSSYVPMFTGWTSPIQPTTGLYRDNQAKLRCTQGKFRLDNIPLRYPISQNVSTDKIIDEILRSGWFTAATPYVTVLDRSQLNENTFMHSLNDVRTTETGASSFPFAGENWKTGETKSSRAIQDVMEVEQGYIWIARDGKLVFRGRHYYALNPTIVDTINVDTEANDASYSYGDLIKNEVKITYYPKTTFDDQIVWVSKEKITMRPGEEKEITVKFEFEEGSKITATVVNGFDALTNPSIITAVDAINRSWAAKVVKSVVLKNGEAVITLKNNSSFVLTITITLKGDFINSAGSVAVVRSDTNSIKGHGLYEHPVISNKEITSENVAKDLGDFVVARNKDPQGVFSGLTIKSRTAAWLEVMLDRTLGDFIQISESQVAATNKKLIIVGEGASWSPGILSIEYVLTRPEVPSPWILGTSKLGTETYLGY